MTEELFREDAYLTTCNASVTAVDDSGIHLDRTVFYYNSAAAPSATTCRCAPLSRSLTQSTIATSRPSAVRSTPVSPGWPPLL